MASPLGATLANIFLCHSEDTCLRGCSLQCKPCDYKRYLDNIFVLFKSELHVELFKKLMKACHPKIKFMFQKEQKRCFNFLDVKFVRENNVFTTSVYRKLALYTRILVVTCR